MPPKLRTKPSSSPESDTKQNAGGEVDLPQVDHWGGRARGRERATRATKSRVVDLCRLQEFKSH